MLFAWSTSVLESGIQRTISLDIVPSRRSFTPIGQADSHSEVCMSLARRLVLATILLLSCSGAYASTLPLYSVVGDVSFNLNPPNRLFPHDFGSFSLADQRFGSLSLVATGTPAPSMTAEARIG